MCSQIDFLNKNIYKRAFMKAWYHGELGIVRVIPKSEKKNFVCLLRICRTECDFNVALMGSIHDSLNGKLIPTVSERKLIVVEIFPGKMVFVSIVHFVEEIKGVIHAVFARHNYGNSTMISVIASSTINYALPNCDILTTTTPTGTYRNFSELCGKAF